MASGPYPGPAECAQRLNPPLPCGVLDECRKTNANSREVYLPPPSADPTHSAEQPIGYASGTRRVCVGYASGTRPPTPSGALERSSAALAPLLDDLWRSRHASCVQLGPISSKIGNSASKLVPACLRSCFFIKLLICRTLSFAIHYNAFEGFSIFQQIASKTLPKLQSSSKTLSKCHRNAAKSLARAFHEAPRPLQESSWDIVASLGPL